jgi:hypothetical protein
MREQALKKEEESGWKNRNSQRNETYLTWENLDRAGLHGMWLAFQNAGWRGFELKDAQLLKAGVGAWVDNERNDSNSENQASEPGYISTPAPGLLFPILLH